MALTIAAVAVTDRSAALARDLLASIAASIDGTPKLCLFHAFLSEGAVPSDGDGIRRIDVTDWILRRAVVDYRTGRAADEPEAYYRTARLADRDLKALPLVHPALAADDVIVLDLDRPASAAIAAARWPTICGVDFFCPFIARRDEQVVLKFAGRDHRFGSLNAALVRAGMPIARDGIARAIVVGRRATVRGRAVAEHYDRLLAAKPVLLPGLIGYLNADVYLTAAMTMLGASDLDGLPTLDDLEQAVAGTPPGHAVPDTGGGAVSTPPIVGVSADADDLARLPVATARFWSQLRPLVDDEARAAGDRALRAMIKGELKVGARTGQVLIEQIARPDGALMLHGHPLRFLSAVDVAMQLEEIFCQRHYAFATTDEAPVVIDCGANTGLASLFFKLSFPAAKVIAYEPNAAAAAVFRQNMATFGFSDVDLREAAVAGADGEVVFNDCVEMPMASSMSGRMVDLGYTVEAHRVPAVSIARDLADGVDFLKVDIEGAEYEVLPALAASLPKVRRLFCEFHFGDGMPRSALTRSLAVLDEAGHDWTYGLAQPAAPSPFLARPGAGAWFASANLWSRLRPPVAA